jgi:2-dehydro-3-deoxygluconokinase
VSTDVVTLGEALVALVADEGRPLVDPGSFTPFVAGAEANVAMGLARLGRTVSFIGRVGADGLGQMVRNGLRGEGVDVHWLHDDPAAPTGALARDRRSLPPAEVVYLRRGSAASQLEPADVEAAGEAIAGAQWLHLTGITPALSPSCRAAVQSALQLARAGGVRVSLDVNLRRRLWSEQEAASVLAELAEGCDVVIAGEDEAVLLCGSAEAAALAERFGVEAVVKLGARGAVGWRKGEWADDAGIAVAPVDVVGAGDAFTAGYLDALLDGAGLAESLRRANACGAIAVAAVGDATGLPTRAELERVLAGGADVVR